MSDQGVEPALSSLDDSGRGGHAFVAPRLSIMMFLEFAIWGSWAVLIAKHMVANLEFTGKQVGYIYLTTAVAAMLSPLIAGWIADRFMPNQVFTGIVHLLGGGLLYYAYTQTSFLMLWVVILCYAIMYMPTIALTNAIAFHHMKDSKKFGYIRVWGTIGWIVINGFLGLYLAMWGGDEQQTLHTGDCLLFAAGLSVVMGIYCFTLPHTPPSGKGSNPLAFLEAFKLTSIPNFTVLLVISFVVAIELPFYYNFTFLFLTEPGTGIGLEPSNANFAMLLGQVGEVVLMVLLAPSLKHLGMRTTIFLGILAWPVRYAIFAIGGPVWLVIAAQSLHGICYSFFFVGGMIAVERLSRKSIRASAQGLIVFATNGAGMLIGSILAGFIYDYCALPDGGHGWAKIFMVPIAVTVVAGIIFLITFSESKFQEVALQIEQEDAAGG